MRNAGGNPKVSKMFRLYRMYRLKSNLLVGLLVVRTFKFLPEFLFRPPSGATFPPGEGIGFACIGRFLTIWKTCCKLRQVFLRMIGTICTELPPSAVPHISQPLVPKSQWLIAEGELPEGQERPPWGVSPGGEALSGVHPGP